MVRLWKHPVAQFLAAGFVTVVLVLVATGRLSGTAAADEAIEDAVATTELLARSVDQLSGWFEYVVVAGRETAPAPTIPDWPRKDMGPLAGIAHLLVGDVEGLHLAAVMAGHVAGQAAPAVEGIAVPAGPQPAAEQRAQHVEESQRHRVDAPTGPYRLPQRKASRSDRPAPGQHVQEKRPPDQRRDRADRQHGAKHAKQETRAQITQHQEDRARQKAQRQEASMIGSDGAAQRVRHHQPDEADEAGHADDGQPILRMSATSGGTSTRRPWAPARTRS